ncbi:hypothetical protein [Streptococcus equi]|uniref:hypothetical protein n=1 Tax=Streptococcus equi TaxID=1336 RepID=UPI0039C5EAAD
MTVRIAISSIRAAKIRTSDFCSAGYAYRYSNRQARLKTATLEKRLEDLKATIQLADRKVKLLDHYLAKEDFTQYAILAKQLLPQLSEIKKESGHLKEHMDISIYRRVTKKANDVESDVQLQLEKIQIAANLKAESLKEQAADPIYKAPELRHYYDNIQADHHSILEKIKGADNHEELLALHEANMRRFQDILQGYLKIKETPKNYYNADERLQQALEAIQQFDLDLDETLRKLNESELKDFDVSLRMMKGSAQASEANTTN